MPYGNQSNAQDYRRSGAQRETTNTNGVSFRNAQARKYMNVSYWEGFIGLEIGVMPEEAIQDFRNAQPPTVRQVFSFADITGVLEICEEVYESIKKTGQFTPVGTKVGSARNNLIEISNGSNIGQPEGVYLVLYKDLDNGDRTNQADFYPFRGREIIRGYDHLSGNSTKDYSKSKEFKDLILILKEAAKAFTNAQAHVIKKAQKADTLSGLKTMSAIAAKNGVSTDPAAMDTQKPNGGYSRGGRSGGWNNNRGGYQGGRSYNNGGNSKFASGNRSTPFASDAELNVDINLNADDLQSVPF